MPHKTKNQNQTISKTTAKKQQQQKQWKIIFSLINWTKCAFDGTFAEHKIKKTSEYNNRDKPFGRTSDQSCCNLKKNPYPSTTPYQLIDICLCLYPLSFPKTIGFRTTNRMISLNRYHSKSSNTSRKWKTQCLLKLSRWCITLHLAV